MTLIFAFLMHQAGAGATAPSNTDVLYAALTRRPAGATQFLINLREYLRARRIESGTHDLAPIMTYAAPIVGQGRDLTDLFHMLIEPEYGLDPTEAAALIMGGDFEDVGHPITAVRAFQRAVGAQARTRAGGPTAHHLAVFAALVDHARDIFDWRRLADESLIWRGLDSKMSTLLVSRQLDKLQSWPLTAADWGYVLSRYAPEFEDLAESDRIVAHFTGSAVLRTVIARVVDVQARVWLQEAAVRRRGYGGEAAIRTLLVPLGDHRSEWYVTSIHRRRAALPAGRGRIDVRASVPGGVERRRGLVAAENAAGVERHRGRTYSEPMNQALDKGSVSAIVSPRANA